MKRIVVLALVGVLFAGTCLLTAPQAVLAMNDINWGGNVTTGASTCGTYCPRQ